MSKVNTKIFQLCVVAALMFAFNPQHLGLASEPTSTFNSEIGAAANVSNGVTNASASQSQQEQPNQDQVQWIKDQLGDGLGVRDQIASEVVSEQFVKQISAVEWLAPLAPVAMSPFFGITLFVRFGMLWSRLVT